VYGAWPTSEPKAAVIWEAFKPESEPRRTGTVGGAVDGKAGGTTRRVRSDAEFMSNSGGIY
jgi:penicillin-binding protein 1A